MYGKVIVEGVGQYVVSLEVGDFVRGFRGSLGEK